MPRTPDSNPPEGRRARASALSEQAARAERRRRLRFTMIVGIVVAAVIAGLTIAVLSTRGGPSRSTAPEAGIPATPMKTALGRATSPPWAAPNDASARVAAAGLVMLGEEGNVEHIHTHLDVIVNGKSVVVPADIGIDHKAQQISPLHTHAENGVIHVESPVKAAFSLGQFMTEWDVALTSDSIGGLKAGGGDEFHAYVNGKERPGNPAAIEFRDHDEIALVYGPADAKVDVPSRYDWPKGK
ncbi:hypothetical protein [Streptomyces sp. H34-S4]|uniref:hypothetical protein n=1 Tax=Streptomyces sp. H34-S4 TaxID=2996463 RepID=UPI002270E3B4|nr:hypothetical protein [Streptomyces sp. H34-S4]MCY0939111.1 hypothetical protein [Streptomyces sp. H34-S4]